MPLSTPSVAPGGSDNPALGIGLMALALFLLAGMDAIAKHLTDTLAAPQILAVRFWIFFTFACVLASRRGIVRSAKSARPGLQIIRALVLTAEMTVFVWAFSRMPLADAHAIAAISPLFVMALAALFLNEKIGPRRWAAVAGGFIGVLIIIRPGTTVFDPFSLVPLAGAAMWAVYQILLRAVAADGPNTTTLYTAAIGVACFSIAAPFVWRSPDPDAWLWLLALGVLGSIGHALLPAAFRLAPASTLQPFAYLLPVWAALLGWMAFAHVPDRWTVAGGALVVASGLYALWRERIAAEST